jgi:type III restriction enzyme
VQTFKKALLNLTIEPQEPQLLEPARMLSSTPAFPWSRPVWEGRKCIFNLVACANAFERAFAKFLDGASDVAAFSKLPEVFGFAIEYTDQNMNLRSYYPDFAATDQSGIHWLLETKGQETPEVQRKDEAARRWCEDATGLTGTQWRYMKVPQTHFEQLQPATLNDLVVTAGKS